MILLALSPGVARADWPSRIFIPYVYLGNGDHFSLTDCDDAIGVKHFILAFIIADPEGSPSWYGEVPLRRNLYADQIDSIRRRGGDVVCSFGGEAGTEIAMAARNPADLQAKYQAVIDRYRFTWLDFDIEGDNLEKYHDANHLRNTALAALQKANPGLIISYTLPVDPDGITSSSIDLLSDARAKGVVVHSANIMTMFFGSRFVRSGKSEGELSIESANKAHTQTLAIDPRIQIGLCPCIGKNGNHGEVFTVDDAKTLRAFADKTSWVCSLSFWSMNRDKETGHTADTTAEIPAAPWAFANVFKGFTD